MNQRHIEGVVESPSETIERLTHKLNVAESRIDALELQLRTERERRTPEDRRIHDALDNLRRTLRPLYESLALVFDDIEAIGRSGGDARSNQIWETWKQRLGPACAKIIDALALQPGMNTTQISIAAGMRRASVPNLIYKLNQAGLIEKAGNRFSLKQP